MDYAAAVEDVVKKFYAAGTNETHTWLLHVQASSEAWTFVWQLLDPSKPWEIQYFAATTLYAKISRQWEEVPKNEYSALQERILNCMKQSQTSNLVLSRLCQTLAAFLGNIHAMDDEERQQSLVEELIEMLPHNSPSMLDLLLRVLSALPGEFERRQGEKRAKLRESLVSSWNKTTWLLEQVFSICDRPVTGVNSATLFLLGLECAYAWLRMGQLPLETTARIYPQLLIAASRYIPNRGELEDENIRGWEVVQDCLITVITHSELRKRPQLLWEWMKGLVCMAHQHGGKFFYEILAALGETHTREILLALTEENNEMKKWVSEGLIELLLECSEQEGRYPINEKSSCVPFAFWYALQDSLATLDEPVESRAYTALKPIYIRLAQALLCKSRLPLSPSEAGDADERELFRCYRQDVADTLTYCYNVLNTELLILLGQRLIQPNINLENWTYIESTIHAFKALSESVGTQEAEYVPGMMDLVILQIPYGNYPSEVLACACSTMGAYAEWIGEHPHPWLAQALRLVELGLSQDSVTIPSASMALKDIARECAPHLSHLAPAILGTIGNILQVLIPGGREGLRLMYAAGKLLNTLSTTDEQLSYLDTTLGPCIMRLRELLQHPVSSARTSVINQLKMVTMLLSTLEGFIGKAVLEGLLPIFNQIISHPNWGRDDTTLEAMYTCAQRSLSSLLHPEVDARPLLPILLTSYKTQPHPAALILLRQLVLLFGKDTDNIIRPVFAEMSCLTLSGVSACRSVENNLSDLADLLESYLVLLAQICKKNIRVLLQVPDQIPDMLRCGIACLILPETGTVKAAGSFLNHAITQTSHLHIFIEPLGQELVCMILQCVAGETARSNLEPYAEVFLALNKNCIEWTAQWLRTAFADGMASVATQTQKEAFVRNILRERVNKLRLCDTLKNFSILCRQSVVGL